MISDFKSKQFMFFIFAGGLAALINFGSRFFYSEFLSYGSAVILAYFTGMITAFFLNRTFVFVHSIHSIKKQFYFFIIVNLVALIQTFIISVGFVEYVFPIIGFLFYPEVVAHSIGVLFPVFTSFIGHKYFSFRSRSESA